MTIASLRRLPLLTVLALVLLPAASSEALCTNQSRPLGMDVGFSGTCVTVTATPDAIQPGGSVDFVASSSSPGTTSWDWDYNNDGTVDETTNTPEVVHVYPTRGRFVASVTTQGGSAVETATTPVVVSETPTASFTLSPGTINEDTSVSFDGSASASTGGAIAGYQWDWTGDGTFSAPSSSAQISHVYAAPGVFHPTLRVTNDLGVTAEATPQTVTVISTHPTARLTAPVSAKTGATVVLDATKSTDPTGSPLSYRWDLDGNGTYETSTGSKATVSTSFANPGTFHPGVRVANTRNESDGTTASVKVSDPAGSGGGSGGGTGGGSGGGSGGGTGGGTGGGKSTKFVVRLLGTPIQRRKTVLKHGVALVARSSHVARGRLTAVTRIGRRKMTLGGVNLRLKAGKNGKVTVKLSRKAAKALRQRPHGSSLRVTVSGVVRDTAGAKRKVTRLVLLRV